MNWTLPEGNVENKIITYVSASLAPKSTLNTPGTKPTTVTTSVPETVSDSSFDHPIPSTCTQFQNIIQEISPVGDHLQRKMSFWKRRAEKSEGLTSTPYENKLEGKEEVKRQKQDRAKMEKGRKTIEEKKKVKQVQSKMKA